MKTLSRIIKTELQLFFYSPVAWLLLIAFIFQAAYAFIDIFTCCYYYEHSHYAWPNLTVGVFLKYPMNPKV